MKFPSIRASAQPYPLFKRMVLSMLIVVMLLVALLPAVASAAPNQRVIAYTVQRGDTLTRIANYFAVTLQSLADYNGIRNPDRIYVGQVLYIDTGAHNPPSICTTYHTVRRGQTLLRIARQYAVWIDHLAHVNNIIDYNRIYIGQVLCIPG